MMDEREREASDPLTPGPRLREMALFDPYDRATQLARVNPSLPTSDLVHLLGISGLTVWQNPAVGLLFLQGIYPYKQAFSKMRTLIEMKATPEALMLAGIDPPLNGGRWLPHLADALQGWWQNEATVDKIIDAFDAALQRRQRRGGGWFAEQEHLEMIEVMAICLLNNRRICGKESRRKVSAVLARIKSKKYRTKGLGDGFSHLAGSGVEDLVKMARGEVVFDRPLSVQMLPRLAYFTDKMKVGWANFSTMPPTLPKMDPSEEAAMLRALRERWPVFPLLRFVP